MLRKSYHFDALLHGVFLCQLQCYVLLIREARQRPRQSGGRVTPPCSSTHDERPRLVQVEDRLWHGPVLIGRRRTWHFLRRQKRRDVWISVKISDENWWEKRFNLRWKKCFLPRVKLFREFTVQYLMERGYFKSVNHWKFVINLVDCPNMKFFYESARKEAGTKSTYGFHVLISRGRTNILSHL